MTSQINHNVFKMGSQSHFAIDNSEHYERKLAEERKAWDRRFNRKQKLHNDYKAARDALNAIANGCSDPQHRALETLKLIYERETA